MCLPLNLSAQLYSKDAKLLTLSHSKRGYALIHQKNRTYTFSYHSLKSIKNDPNLNAIRYFKQLQLNDNKTLTMRVMDQKKNLIEKELNFFMGTHDIQAKMVNDHFIFLTARTSNDELKIALIDQSHTLRFTQTVRDLSIKAIHNIFTHLDGSYSIALKVDNYKNRLTYFNRGTGESDIAILKFSPLLHLTQTHFIGDSLSSHTIEVLKDKNENYFIFNQLQSNEIILYQHDFHKNESRKKIFSLKEKYPILSISSKDFKTFFLGSDRSHWLTLNIINSQIESFELAKIHGATISSISKLPNNSILISGAYKSSGGQSNLFIHNYSPFQSYLWGKTYHSPFNDAAIKHSYNLKNIFLTALVHDKKQTENLALFTLDFKGKPH